MSNGVVIKQGKVSRVDVKSGVIKGPVGDAHAKAAASDGDYIVIVYDNGRAARYRADTGVTLGPVGNGTGSAVSCGISDGIILLTDAKGHSMRYDARGGSVKGSA